MMLTGTIDGDLQRSLFCLFVVDQRRWSRALVLFRRCNIFDDLSSRQCHLDDLEI